MRSQLQDGNLLLMLKQHVTLLTGKILVILEIFFYSNVHRAKYPKQTVRQLLMY